MTAQFGDYQNKIYAAGLRGLVPALPMTFAGLEAGAEAALPPSIWSYVAGGAGDEHTQRANVAAFRPAPPGATCPSSCTECGSPPRSSWPRSG